MQNSFSSRSTIRVWVGLCSVGARRKSRILVLGAEKEKSRRLVTRPSRFYFLGRFSLGGGVFFFRVPPRPSLPPPPHPPLQYLNKYEGGVFILRSVGPNFFWGGRKSCFAAEHHNEAAPKKKKKKPRFFRLGAEKYDFSAPKEQRPMFGRSVFVSLTCAPLTSSVGEPTVSSPLSEPAILRVHPNPYRSRATVAAFQVSPTPYLPRVTVASMDHAVAVAQAVKGQSPSLNARRPLSFQV